MDIADERVAATNVQLRDHKRQSAYISRAAGRSAAPRTRWEGSTTCSYTGIRTTVVCAAALALAACGGGGGGRTVDDGPSEEEIAEAKARSEAVGAALEAARAIGAGGVFDDAPYMVAPVVAGTNDGTTVTIGVTESGTPRGGSARTGDLAEQEDGPAAIDGWTGLRLRRGTTAEHLVVYADPGAPEAMAFTPENLNRLSEVSGLTGEAVPESGLEIQAAWLPVIRSVSLRAAPPGGSIDIHVRRHRPGRRPRVHRHVRGWVGPVPLLGQRL